jgi:hypothetical protein
VDHGVLDAAAERLRELGNLMTADGLMVTHPLHSLRRLIDAPLPLRLGNERAGGARPAGS